MAKNGIKLLIYILTARLWFHFIRQMEELLQHITQESSIRMTPVNHGKLWKNYRQGFYLFLCTMKMKYSSELRMVCSRAISPLPGVKSRSVMERYIQFVKILSAL